MNMAHLHLLQAWIFLLSLVHLIGGKKMTVEELEESLYLYHDEDSSIIFDYEPDPEQGDRPTIIYDPNMGPRVIEFYAPWCPHCRHFQKHYVEFAEQVHSVLAEYNYHGPEVQFCAISCTANKQICRDMDVHGYPKIRLFPAGATGKNASTEVVYWKLHPFDTLNSLGVRVDKMRLHNDGAVANGLPSDSGFLQRLRKRVQGPSSSSMTTTNSLGWPPRTREQVFDDAFLSFDFNLRSAIFTTGDPLSNTTQTSLFDWLELLKKATPVVWDIQVVIKALLANFDQIVQSEEKLIAILDGAGASPKQKTWSDSCTKGEKGMGYTCGLWELFHIVSVGLVEYNMMISANDDIVLGEVSLTTVHGSEVLRNFIDSFFGCEVCRLNFVSAYDACAHDRCNRLTDQDMSPKQWIQFPVWLFETHNAVNARLLREKADRENRVATPEEEVERRWPPKSSCPKCWTDSGGWDEEVVYKFLRVEYWSEDDVSEEYREDFGANQHNNEEQDNHSDTTPLLLQLIPLTVVLLLAGTWYSQKLKRAKTGRHKKIDDSLGCSLS